MILDARSCYAISLYLPRTFNRERIIFDYIEWGMLGAELFEIVIDCVYAEPEWTQCGAEEIERANEAGERVRFENGIPLVCLSRNGYEEQQ